MSSSTAVLFYELRRHASTLLMGTIFLLVVPVVRAFQVGNWRYWDGAWNLWGAAIAVYVVGPILIVSMASSGWAAERSSRTLDWLYARPISGVRIFALRATAVLIVALVWTVFSLAVNRAGPTLFAELERVAPDLGTPLALGSVVLLVSLGAGLFGSAISNGASAAFRLSTLLVLSSAIAVVLIPRWMPHRRVLAIASENGSSLVSWFTFVLLVGWGTSLFVGAWVALRRGPDDDRRLRRAVSTAIPIATTALIAAIGVLLWPFSIDGTRSSSLWIGGDDSFYFSYARGTQKRATHPVLVVGGEHRPLRSIFSYSGYAYPNPERGVIIVDHMASPVLIDRDGRVQSVEVPDAFELDAFGWSPQGRRFAWMFFPSDPKRIAILEPDGSVRVLDPRDKRLSGPWIAAWIDDDQILLTTSAYAAREGATAWWLVLSTTGEVVTGPHDLPAGTALSAPALDPLVSRFHRTALPRLAGVPAALLVDLSGGSPPHVVRLRIEEGALDVAAQLRSSAVPRYSLGSLDDGSLIWAIQTLYAGEESARGVELERLGLADEVATTVCEIPDLSAQPVDYGRRGEAVYLRLLGESGRWVIYGAGRARPMDIWACDPSSGETRKIVGPSLSWLQQTQITERGIWDSDGWWPID